MSDNSTPIRGSPGTEEGDSQPRKSALDIGRSPQVRFEADFVKIGQVKHERSTPSSGRGRLKKIRERVAEKLSGRRLMNESPSRMLARSMLTFDLESARSDDITGDGELFVKFVTDRRKSSGRGTLRTLINKRINFQVGVQAIAQRSACNEPPEAATLKDSNVGKTKTEKKQRKKKKDKVKVKECDVPTTREDSDDFEIPLGQEDEQQCDIADLSQTQVLEKEDSLVSQTQIYSNQTLSSSSSSSSPMPFLSTPNRLETVFEEDAAVPLPKQRKEKNRFVDDEAEESDDGQGDEESSSGSDGDLSDLIASLSPTEADQEDSYSSLHAKLHREWIEQQENRRLFLNHSHRQESVGAVARARARAIAVAAAASIASKPKPKPKLKTKFISQYDNKIDPISTSAVRRVPLPSRPLRSRYNNRRSSVSSASTEIDIVRIPACNRNRRKPTQENGDGESNFTFLRGPSEEALAVVSERLAAKTDAEIKSAGGSRLMGSKRFVFGGSKPQ